MSNDTAIVQHFREKLNKSPHFAPSTRPRATRVTPVTDAGMLRAFVDLRWGPLEIRGCRVIQQPGQRAWCSLPQTRSEKDNKWYPVILCSDPELDRLLKETALSAWREELGIPEEASNG